MANRHHRITRWIKPLAAAGLVPLLVVTGLPACVTATHRVFVREMRAESQSAARSLFGWSRVETVPVGTATEVQLFEDALSSDDRRVTGRFHSATADSLTLTLDDGTTRTLARSAVQMVETDRPIWKRSAGWTVLLDAILVFTVLAALFDGVDAGAAMRASTLIGLPASLPGFLLQRTQQIYNAPPQGLITQVDVLPLSDGDVVPHNQAVIVSVAHAGWVDRWLNEPVGLTVCLSSRPDRCTGGWAVFEKRVRNLVTPLTATLRFGNELVPADTPVPIYVHVVLTSGPSWRPVPDDQALPQPGDSRVLDVETVTRHITIVDQ